MYNSVDDACEKMVSVKERFEPDPANVVTYERMYQRYIELYDSLRGLFAKD